MKSTGNIVASAQLSARVDRRAGSPRAQLVVTAVVAIASAACSRAAPSATSSSPSSAPAPADSSGVFHGRTIATPMGYGGADWLERGDRETSEQPERVLDALAITPTMQIADIGAGIGYFTIRLARRAPQGRVFATDIQAPMLERLKANLSDAGLANVTTILCTDEDAGLAPASVDLELMVDVYHELAHPAETLQQLRAALKPGGRLVLVEYRGDDPNVGIKPEHTMTVAQVEDEVGTSGFRVLKVHEFLPKQRIFEFVSTTN